MLKFKVRKSKKKINNKTVSNTIIILEENDYVKGKVQICFVTRITNYCIKGFRIWVPLVPMSWKLKYLRFVISLSLFFSFTKGAKLLAKKFQLRIKNPSKFCWWSAKSYSLMVCCNICHTVGSFCAKIGEREKKITLFSASLRALTKYHWRVSIQSNHGFLMC